MVTDRKQGVGKLGFAGSHSGGRDMDERSDGAGHEAGAGRDISAVPRAVLSAAISLVHHVERAVIGERRMRTARGNAWEAVCADRARARQQADVDRLVAALVAKGHRAGVVNGRRAAAAKRHRASGSSRTVGSSPRSRASQA